MPTTLMEPTERSLRVRAARSQAECRLPSLVAGVVHHRELAWTYGTGTVGDGAPDADMQYRIGSITKIFTAVQILRLRDEGRLRLSDRLDDHLPGSDVGDRTIAELLAHTSGVQAETAGPWWERAPGLTRDELLAQIGPEALRHPAGRRFHYSNVAYGLLGLVIERHRSRSWWESVRDEVLRPLEMTRTTYAPQTPHAAGWAVHPWADVLLAEPAHDAGSMAPAGQLWSTVTDLGRWARFLTGDTGDVLSSQTLDEMCEPVVVHDEGWSVGHGLGLQLLRRGDRVVVGHGGSMPGFLAQILVDREEHAGAIVLTNATAGLDDVAGDLLDRVVSAEPRVPDPWRPDDDVPDDVFTLLGPWYWGPTPVALRWTGGMLRLDPLTGRGRASRFTRNDDGTWTGLDGYYRGETLRVHADADGAPYLDVASFVFTRTPYDPAAPIPGGLDEEGWRT